jgi:hypothetical protein
MLAVGRPLPKSHGGTQADCHRMNPASPLKPAPTSEHTAGVDYHATSVRIHFEDLSPDVREAADSALGSALVRASTPVTSGFTNAYAGRVLLRDGRVAFLKAAGPEYAHPVLALAREAQVLEALGSQLIGVPLIGAGAACDGGQVLALDWVEGHLPGFPWTEDEVALVRVACEAVAAVPSSSMDGLAPGRLADDLLADQTLASSLTTGLPLPRSLERLPTWLPARIDEVLAVAGDTDALRVGDQLNHSDLRPDNLLIGRRPGETRDRAYVLDWNWVALGPAWCDWVGLIAVYMLGGLDNEPPPGVTMAMRHHQRHYGRIFLDTLATHTGWR